MAKTPPTLKPNDETVPQLVRRALVDILGIDEHEITRDSLLVADLGADSLDIVELVMALEEEYGVEIPESVEGTWGNGRVSDILAELRKAGAKL